PGYGWRPVGYRGKTSGTVGGVGNLGTAPEMTAGGVTVTVGVVWVGDIALGPACAACLIGTSGVASTGVWDARTLSLAISSRGTSMRTVPSIAFLVVFSTVAAIFSLTAAWSI